MDYVLFGMGYGATLMLLGWALRTFGPERKYKDVHPEDIDRVVEQRRWVRFIQGLGGVIAIAGTALVLFTFIVMLVNPDDETGGFIALVIWGFLAVAVLIWCWFYVSSFGLTGIWSREDGYGLRRTTYQSPRTSLEGISTARVVPTPDISEGPMELEDSITATEPAIDTPGTEPHEADEEDVQADDVEPSVEELEIAQGSDSDQSTDPEYDFGDSSDTTVPSELGGRSEAVRRLRERQTQSGNSTS